MAAIYLDANATTPLLPEVVDAMAPFWSTHFGNPSSVHRSGQHARSAVEHARESVAQLLQCRPSEIIFTSGGTEGDNLALFGCLHPHSGKPAHLVTTAIEHHAILHAAEALAQRNVAVTLLPCNASGLVEPAALAQALRSIPHTGNTLVSVMLANNETGVLQPIRELASIAHEAGALFHTDAVQGAGKLPLNVNELGCDLLTLTGHKMYAPKGVGALYLRRKLQLQPLFFGGSHERQRRAGTENVPGIVALGQASLLARLWLGNDTRDNGPTRLAHLRDRLELGLLSAIPRSGINGGGQPRTPNTINIYFDGIDAEALVIALDLKGIAVSGGSACQSGATEPSHVLTAMRLPQHRARASIRISLSRLNTPQEIDDALTVIPAAVSRLRDLSLSSTPLQAAAATAP
ncbi:MAG: cysteine desulfurase NifS [Acidobacteriaceae bacterium]